jgi:peroxiredoxin Q/BCP
MVKVEVGSKSPNFSLISSDGKKISLSDFTDKKIVIYFYPKDDTPGCTLEANDFKENFSEFEKLNTVIIGISKDNIKQHHNFKTRYNLPFILLSDEKAEVINLYGAWIQKSMFGKKYFGIDRSTFFLDENHIIQKIWNNVKVKNHASEVLNFIKSQIN